MTEQSFVTDGGLETDLIFNHGADLPDFAAFPLLDDDGGRGLLADYYDSYAAIAAGAGASLLLETPTWRANPDWGTRLGYDAAALDRVNRAAVDHLQELGSRWNGDLAAYVVSGQLGPRGDGYRPGAAIDPDEAADYHRPQLASFQAAGADRATVLTLTDPGEAIGISRAAGDVGLPVAIGFTVETDGRLPGGTTLGEAIALVDADAPPAYYVINCAHPTHVARGVDDGAWRDRVHGLRVNASTMSHAELDESEELDAGDPAQLALDVHELRRSLPALSIIGGCCGTDARHVAAMWGVRLISGADVDHPRDAELVDDHAELVAPRLLLERHRDRAAVGERLPVATQLVVVVAAEADREVVAGLVGRSRRGVGDHQGEAGICVEPAVHDLVGNVRVVAVLGEGVELRLATEDGGVELDRVARVAVEADVGVEQ